MEALALVQNGGLMSSPSDFIVKGEQVMAISQRKKKHFFFQPIVTNQSVVCQRWRMFAGSSSVSSPNLKVTLCLIVCLFYIGIALVFFHLWFVNYRESIHTSLLVEASTITDRFFFFYLLI